MSSRGLGHPVTINKNIELWLRLVWRNYPEKPGSLLVYDNDVNLLGENK